MLWILQEKRPSTAQKHNCSKYNSKYAYFVVLIVVEDFFVCFFCQRCNRKLCVHIMLHLTLTIEGKRSRRAKHGDFEQSAEIQRENRFT